ncbi:MAG TPA: glycosyltransferase family 39 protein [Solirubrobacteraceae bacterium]|nr:glycosyltransferase family 39 protein [Solirubrobacteraceae bacterium]
MVTLATPGRHLRAQRRWATPIAALVAVSVLSLAARVAFLGSPCHQPCKSASAHVLVFDESYYVNAARVIAGVQLPPGAHYTGIPAGDDPNSEHPQLAKAIVAGAIGLFGDGPLAWRLPSILLGSLAILGMFALVTAAGGRPWVGVGAAALMAADNLLLVHSRIATLDIYAVTAMIWAAVLYLRGRPLFAGAVVGVGACAKEVTPYVLLALLALELLRAHRDRSAVGPALARVAMCTAAAAAVFVGLLALLDVIAPPYDPLTHKLVGGGVFGHIRYLLDYGAHQTSPRGPKGIASYPWGWLVDIKPILYLNINPQRPVPGLFGVHPQAHFLGMISPAILLVGLPGLATTAWRALGPGRSVAGDVELLGLAWFAGTFLPFVLLSLIDNRTSYLYYMVIVMPGIYIAAAQLVARIGPPPRWIWAWIVTIAIAVVVMYPFTPLP